MPTNLENSAVATGLEKVSFHSNPKERHAKECSNYCTIALISHASKVMLKILQARLQQYVTCERPNVQAGFRKGRGTRDQIANFRWVIEKARELTNPWKDAQHHSLSEKCKSKPHCGTITRQSEWLRSKSLQAINAGEAVEKREPSYTVGGNAN